MHGQAGEYCVQGKQCSSYKWWLCSLLFFLYSLQNTLQSSSLSLSLFLLLFLFFFPFQIYYTYETKVQAIGLISISKIRQQTRQGLRSQSWQSFYLEAKRLLGVIASVPIRLRILFGQQRRQWENDYGPIKAQITLLKPFHGFQPFAARWFEEECEPHLSTQVLAGVFAKSIERMYYLRR